MGARKHLNDNWNNTVFLDETAFRLFRNTIRQWWKGEGPTRCLPKDRTKFFAWRRLCLHGKTSLFCFKNIITGGFYVEILQKHKPEI